VIGTGAEGALPVMKQVHQEARRRKAGLVVLPTAQAIGAPTRTTKDTDAVLHVTCSTSWRSCHSPCSDVGNPGPDPAHQHQS
jgi:hypothetical protein